MTCCFRGFEFIRNFFTPSESRTSFAEPALSGKNARSSRLSTDAIALQPNYTLALLRGRRLSKRPFSVPCLFILLLSGALISPASFATVTEARIYYIFQCGSGTGPMFYKTPQEHYAAVQQCLNQAGVNNVYLDLFPVPSDGKINGQYKSWQYHYQSVSQDGTVDPVI